jgi:hypothetical protein
MVKANAVLRQLLAGVTVDYRTGSLVLLWRHGGDTQVQYAMPTEELEEAEEAVA